MSFIVHGFCEAVLSVSDSKPWRDLFCDAAGWEVAHGGLMDTRLLELWQANSQQAAEDTLLRNPGDGRGHLRLCQLHLPQQQAIRAATHSWDSGAIFDLNVRVHDVHAVCNKLIDLGWQALSPPIPWSFGSTDVIECLLSGPDSIVLAVIERTAPALTGWNFKTMSRVFNSSQIVRDMDSASAFYQRLGFKPVVSHAGPLPDLGGRVLGLSAEEAAREAVELRVLQPHGEMDGSVELVKFASKRGKHVGASAVPTGLGISVLRFPVSNIHAFAMHVAQQQIVVQPPGLIETRIEPYGDVFLLALRTPDGAWLEFFEAAESPKPSGNSNI